jgi:hypothetical protein
MMSLAKLRKSDGVWVLLRLPRWLSVGLVALALIGVGWAQVNALRLFADHAATVLPFPYQLNYGEGPLLDQTLRLAAGESIYPADLDAPPFTIANYPPLFLLVQLPFVEAYGAAFWYGRALSLVSSLLAALLIGQTTWNVTRDWIGALVGGVTWLTIPYVLHWSPLNRIDNLALMLSWAGLCIITWGGAQNTRLTPLRLLFTALCFTGAAFTRQTYLLAAPLAAFVWLLWGQGRPLRALGLALVTALLVLLGFNTLLVLTDGGAWTHLVTANANAFLLANIDLYADEIARHMPLFLVGGALLLVGGVWRGGRSSAWWLAAPYSLGALAVALTIGKIGSDVNYLYELSAAFCLISGVLIGAARRLPLLRAALLVGLMLQVAMMQHLSEERYYDTLVRRTSRDRLEDIERLRERIEDHERVLVDEFSGLLPQTGRTLLFQPFERTQMAQDGNWDESQFLLLLATHEYDLILMYQPPTAPDLPRERWTRAMRNTINEYYRPTARIGETTVYEPR